MKNLCALIFSVSLSIMLSMPASADDTDIFSGTSTSSVPPNVLIIFDSSGTMNDPIHQETYNAAHPYADDLDAMGRSSRALVGNYVYYISGYTGGGHETPVYETFPPSKKDPIILTVDGNYCASAKAKLTTDGWWMGNISTTAPYSCTGATTLYRMYSGNYLNYLTWISLGGGTGGSDAKINIAQGVISRLVHNTENTNVRFGVMIYNRTQQGQGGEIIAPVGSTPDQVDTAIANEVLARKSLLVSDTPLAECLAEAGLYFAGKPSWSSNQDEPPYTSPIQWRCQKNYIIIMTDGMPTSDQGENNRFENIFNNRNTHTGNALTQYYNTIIGDFDGDSTVNGALTGVDSVVDSFGGTHLLDDVAKFLHDTDLRVGGTDLGGGSFDDPYVPIQNITTFAIGFDAATDFTFLNRVVDENHGNGCVEDVCEAFVATSSTQLEIAFDKIMGAIFEANATFIAPVVPVNKLNKVYSGNSVYLSLFKPISDEPFWMGNIKKFGLDDWGNLKDKNNNPATDNNGQILEDAISCWSSEADGSTTELGGVGASLLNPPSARNFYTNTGASAELYNSANWIVSTNAAVTARVGTTDPADLVDWVTARGVYAPAGSDPRTWVLGDILHSKPATMFYGNYNILFVGSNDGFLHAFIDDDKGTPSDLSTDTVTEAWAFAPWDLLPNLHLLRDGARHPYFVDGSPVIFSAGNYQYVTFGLRRGGSSYYCLRVGTVDASGNYTGGYTMPTFKWQVPFNLLGVEDLGQSWARPWVSTIRTGSGADAMAKVILLAGGYDQDNQDLGIPAANDSKGRAVYAVDALSGELMPNLNFNASNYSDITNCITELMAFDYNTDGCDDTIYAGTLGGSIFGFHDRDMDGTWERKKIFQAPTVTGHKLKFFYEPDVGMEAFGDYIYIGSGDREHPGATTPVNRLYAIKNPGTRSGTDWTWTNPGVIQESSLIDVTEYNYASIDPAEFAAGSSRAGWYIKLNEQAGEKVVSSPLLYSGIVFFTTYAPDQGGTTGVDYCGAEGLGGGRLYALDYLTGKAVIDFRTGGDDLNRDDRYMPLGVGIPSPPTLVVTKEGGAKLIIGTSGAGGTTGAKTITIPSTSKAKMYYWKQN